MPTSPDVHKVSAAWLKQAEEEFLTLRRVVSESLFKEALGTDYQSRLERLLVGSELTYLLRLFSSFEAGLSLIGPSLHVPCVFSDRAGLREKLDQIGAAMKMDPGFRQMVDKNLRELRNELAHGHSLVPRRTFHATYELMRTFRKGCY